MLIKQIVDFIALHEGLRLKPYRDATGTPTIGYGSTFYEDGKPVTMSDKAITKERATQLYKNVLNAFAKKVKENVRQPLNAYQFGALVSLAYNIGIKNFKASTLLKKVNDNPNDLTIEDEFNKFIFSKGVKLNGLVKRRQAEANLYKKKTNTLTQIMETIKTFFSTHKTKIITIGCIVAVFLIIRKLTKK